MESKVIVPAACQHVRWMIRLDMPIVLEIEQRSFARPWSEEDFIRALRQRNCISMCAEDASQNVVGFIIYELHQSRITILNMAVHPDCRRISVGRTMIEKLVSKLAYQRRCMIDAVVWERNLDALLFFKSQGFRSIKTLRNHFENNDDDAYLMRYRLRKES